MLKPLLSKVPVSNALCPSQGRAYHRLLKQIPAHSTFVLSGKVGLGKTAIIETLLSDRGGALFQLKDFMNKLGQGHPFAMEETFEQLVMEALTNHDMVIVDDMHLFCKLAYHNHAYPRLGLLDIPIQIFSTYAAQTNKKLIFSGQPCALGSLGQQACRVGLDEFAVEDYQFISDRCLSSESGQQSIDYAKVHRFAGKLNAYQLKEACQWLEQAHQLDTDSFIDYLKSRQLVSNINLGEVQAVELSSLKGADDVIKSLEANIILPLENDALAAELDLKPKRGVLLVGPPGTGKTTIGRALAHRLKSKFFLIDGTFISGTGDFYGRVHQIFEAAKQSAPAVVFIDDGDVIFEGGDELGFYRYLLTLLDGLESESVGRVCLMMTAMNVSSLPPALVRSGRVELWLELQLPNDEAREAILKQHLDKLPVALSNADVSTLVSKTEGFTGADLKRLVEDGKTLYAYDRAQQKAPSLSTSYFVSAVELVQRNKAQYMQADQQARQQSIGRPSNSARHHAHLSRVMIGRAMDS